MLASRLAKTLAALFPDGEIPRFGVAVSGGGDSFALLDLLHLNKVQMDVVSINHGLRPEAASEVALVSNYCSARCLSHDVLHWTWDGRGSVQLAAREGRSKLMSQWAKTRGISHVVLGHTKDDQAETFLMRLTRGSGVDGLAAMAPVTKHNGMIWLRPMLGIKRSELRAHLTLRNILWAEDPSNEDMAYDRVRARKALDVLTPLGLHVDRLALTADHMGRARVALDYAESILTQEVARIEAGDVVIEWDRFNRAPEELRTRLLANALGWVSGQIYRPRYTALKAAMATKSTYVLQGCVIIRKKNTFRISREWAAVAKTRCAVGELWDGRWLLSGKAKKSLYVRALGEEGLRECAAWRNTGKPRQSLFATPSIWHEKTLISAPLAGLARGWRAEIVPERLHFPRSFESH